MEETTPSWMLAGDIGGTNSRLVIFAVDMVEVLKKSSLLDRPDFNVKFSRKYKNSDFPKFKDVMERFLDDAEKALNMAPKISSASLAVAGPVNQGRVNFTNIGWVIDASEIRMWFNIGQVAVVNDFEANGYGILTLKETELESVQEGLERKNNPICVIGAGTGLGECFLTPVTSLGGRFFEVYPTEGGHVEFAPKTEMQFKLLSFLQNRFKGRVSVERVVSGKGLLNVYEFLREEFPDQVDLANDKRILASNEAGRDIAELAYDDGLCSQAMDIMFEVYGTEAGSCVLKYLPYGGIYICGGIAPKNVERIKGEDGHFMRAFVDKGRMAPILTKIPVKIVMAEELGLRGAQLMSYKTMVEKKGLSFDVERTSPTLTTSRYEFGNSTVGDDDDTKLNADRSGRGTNLPYLIEVVLTSSIAASVALLIGFGGRWVSRPRG